LQTYGKIDSKFRFVILASKRAKQLLKGSKVKIKTRSRNPIRIAQIEVKAGVVDYEIIQSLRDELLEPEEQVLGVVDAGGEADDAGCDPAADDDTDVSDDAEEPVDADYDEELPDPVVGEDKDDE
jgi:DNA-directed RNA polymerase omega subunit